MAFCIVARERGTAENHRHRDAEAIHLVEVFLHHRHRFHQQPAHADCVGARAAPRVEDGLQRLLDADVVDLEAIVREDDVNEILADVVHIASDGGKHDARLLRRARFGLLHVRLKKRDGLFHHCGRLQHERQLHLTRAEQFADGLHTAEKMIVDDRQRRIGLHRLGETLVEVAQLAINDVLRKTLFDRQIRERLLLGGVFHAIRKQRDEVKQRIEILRLPSRSLVAALIEDEPFSRVPMLGGNAVPRQDLRRMHDRRSQATRARMMQVHAVEHRAHWRIQAEGNVREAENDAAARERPRNRGNSVERL